MDVSGLKKLGAHAIAQRLGRAKRRSTLSIAASVVGVATAGVAIGYGVSRLFKAKKAEGGTDAPATPGTDGTPTGQG